MLRTQDRGEPDTCPEQAIHCVDSGAVHRGLIGDDRDSPASDERKAVADQHLETRTQPDGRDRRRRRLARRQQDQQGKMRATRFHAGRGFVLGSLRPYVLAMILALPGAPVHAQSSRVNTLLKRMTTAEKAAQLIMPWVFGGYTSWDDPVFTRIVTLVDSLKVG